MHNCYSCGYYNSKCHYCNDLDVEVDDPGDPVVQKIIIIPKYA